ncbi:ATP-binding protein [Faecalicatena contorta]|uniref:Histidine kinase-, DNA gyrase B-, and HSP90-like ATPase n=1 Tax=Faecalicatena contorta TaxID=39482 RepID=A0A315ZJN1_9FIRM|nr:ATP-binding protein [Faecalicatena contorta]PWJ45825.1 histidine kinase/DNA gyrase B/HSP90-like ATPase [Faecalicatena contorta]SUQ16431.1 Histidine kinase-, DNA gyrase B-, and HSP90-like ATPase [Faecalicatena contorta]
MQEKLTIEAADISRLLGTVGSPLIVITELIKNSVDADAAQIDVIYDSKKRLIQICDNGTGISLEEIRNLAKPGFSTKKLQGNIRNKHGFFFTGNKGLGILSCFSLCEEIIIDTFIGNTQRCQGSLNKNGLLKYEVLENVMDNSKGTIITLQQIPDEIINFLTSSSELQKIRHISTYLYKRNSIHFPEIRLKIDEELPKSIFLDVEFTNMLYDVTFSYDKSTQSLKFKCESDIRKNINDSLIELNTFDIESLEMLTLKEYGIKKTIPTRTNDNADLQSYTNLDNVPSFEGRIVVYDRQNAGAILKQYGAGVNVYVNQFALYNYLSSDNDWLGLADFSQRKKVTNLRPHNVFGYVNFNEFNENQERLQISNERADFIQDQTFTKLMYLLKGALMFLTFNIDLAEKNPKFKVDKQPSDSDEKNDKLVEKKNDDLGNSPLEKTETKINENQNNASKPTKNDIYTGSLSGVNKSNIGSGVYRPEDNYKPKKYTISGLRFTQEDGKVIEKLKNKDNLSNKIYHIIYELSNLNTQNYCCATAGLYRGVLECSTRYFINNHKDKLTFTENQLSTNILNVINFLANKQGMDKQAKKWRETITKRYLIDCLNEYMHNSADVDIDFMEQTWKTIKTYIINCISD